MSNSPRQARDALARFDRRLRAALVVASNRVANVVADRAETGAPKLTGGLADSIKVDHATGGGSGLVVASVTVGEGLESPGEAAAVEFGTAKTPPQPFFRPACSKGRAISKTEMSRSARSAH